MLNKELLLTGSDSLEPVLSIYISPDLKYSPSVSGRLSSGESFYVSSAGETTFKFSEIDLTADILIKYFDDMELSTHTLTLVLEAYSGGAERAPAIMLENFRISDVTQSASIAIE